MVKYPPARQSPHLTSQTWVKSLWILLGVGVLIVAMTKPAQAAGVIYRPNIAYWALVGTQQQYATPDLACATMTTFSGLYIHLSMFALPPPLLASLGSLMGELLPMLGLFGRCIVECC